MTDFNPVNCRKYPSRWPLIRGKELFRVVDNRSETGTEELLTVSHITGITPRSQKNVTMFQAESLAGYKLCEIGDIAANTMWMWQGAIGVSKYVGLISPGYDVYRQKDNHYNPRYLDILLREKHLVDVYHSLSTGIRPSRLRLYPDVFLTIRFPVPPRTEQDQIVRFLDWKVSAINRLIGIKKRQIDTINALRGAMIEKLLHKFPIEKTTRLKQLGTFFKGGGFSRENLVDDKTYPAILYGDIYTQYEYQTDTVNHHIDGQAYNSSRKIFKGDIVMAGTGETKDEIGKAILYMGEEIVAVGGDVIAFHPNEDVNAEYLLYQLYSQNALKHRYINGKGDIIVHIYPIALGNTIINLPNKIAQRQVVTEIDTTIHNANKHIGYVNQSISVLQELKTRLTADTVTGKIDVRNIEIPDYEFVGEESQAEEEFDAEGSDNGE